MAQADSSAVISRLSARIGQLEVENAILQVALEAAQSPEPGN